MDLQGIRKARKAARFTQEELARALGISRATISKYESGDIVPSLGQLGKIAKVLNTSVYEMIGTDWSGIDMSDAFGPCQSASTQSMSPRTRLEAAYAKLNTLGQEKAADAVETIAGNPKYQRQDMIPPTSEEKPPKTP